MSDNVHGEEQTLEANQDNLATEAKDAAERERLLEKRRARQMAGSSHANGRRSLFAGAAFACGAIVIIASVGPSKALKLFGLREDTSQETSQIDLDVDRHSTNTRQLDFSVPEPPPLADSKVDPNAELKRQVEDLRKQLNEVAKANKGPDVSLDDVQKLLDRYNAQMSEKLEQERQKGEEENKRLRAEALRLADEQKRANEAEKLDAATRKEQEKIDDRQRESNGVVIDGSNAEAVGSGDALQPSDSMSGNDRFLAAAADSEVKTSLSRSLPDPSRTIVQGTIISAVLETAINTELPGNIRAQVIEPVFSFNGKRILFAAGTTLVGKFNDKVDLEQKRVLIAWNRAITPDGKSVSLGSTGTDLLGRAGTAGNVDNHYGKKIGAAVLLSTISALPSLVPSLTGSGRSSSRGGTMINIGASGAGDGNPGTQAASNIAGAISNQGKGILDKYLDLPPTLRVPQGEEIRVFVNQDLVIR